MPCHAAGRQAGASVRVEQVRCFDSHSLQRPANRQHHELEALSLASGRRDLHMLIERSAEISRLPKDLRHGTGLADQERGRRVRRDLPQIVPARQAEGQRVVRVDAAQPDPQPARLACALPPLTQIDASGSGARAPCRHRSVELRPAVDTPIEDTSAVEIAGLDDGLALGDRVSRRIAPVESGTAAGELDNKRPVVRVRVLTPAPDLQGHEGPLHSKEVAVTRSRDGLLAQAVDPVEDGTLRIALGVQRASPQRRCAFQPPLCLVQLGDVEPLLPNRLDAVCMG